MTHEELCEATARKFVQTFALWEVKGKWENPDVITWNSSGRSTIYEIKRNLENLSAAASLCTLHGVLVATV